MKRRAQSAEKREGKFAQESGKRGFVPGAYLTRNQSGGGLPGDVHQAAGRERKTGKTARRGPPPTGRPFPVRDPQSRRDAVPAPFPVPRDARVVLPKGKREGAGESGGGM